MLMGMGAGHSIGSVSGLTASSERSGWVAGSQRAGQRAPLYCHEKGRNNWRNGTAICKREWSMKC